jgi:hypothetical protein
MSPHCTAWYVLGYPCLVSRPVASNLPICTFTPAGIQEFLAFSAMDMHNFPPCHARHVLASLSVMHCIILYLSLSQFAVDALYTVLSCLSLTSSHFYVRMLSWDATRTGSR